MGTLANSTDPDEMQHKAAFHQGLHCLHGLKQPPGMIIHQYLEHSTLDLLKYIMESSILIALMCMGKSIRIQEFIYPISTQDYGTEHKCLKTLFNHWYSYGLFLLTRYNKWDSK